MGKPRPSLSKVQQLILNVLQRKGSVLVADVMYLTRNDRGAARNALDTLIKKGYAKKKTEHIRVPTPFLLGSGSTHLQQFARYYPIAIQPTSDQSSIDTSPSGS